MCVAAAADLFAELEEGLGDGRILVVQRLAALIVCSCTCNTSVAVTSWGGRRTCRGLEGLQLAQELPNCGNAHTHDLHTVSKCVSSGRGRGEMETEKR